MQNQIRLNARLIQGEANSGKIPIKLPLKSQGIDLAPLSFSLRALSEKETLAIAILEKTISDSGIELTWSVSPDFTAVSGVLEIFIVGADSGGNVIIKFDCGKIVVREDPTLEDYPVPTIDIIEQLFAQLSAAVAETNAAKDSIDQSIETTTELVSEAKTAENNTIAAAQSVSEALPEAQVYAENAGLSAQAAEDSEQSALSSKLLAEGFATTATEKAAEAVASKASAALSEQAAAQSKNDALTHCQNAANSAIKAQSSAQSIEGAEKSTIENANKAQAAKDGAELSSEQAALDALRAKSEADRAAQITGNFGWYQTLEALTCAHPIGHDGAFAIIGATDSLWIWDGDTNAWLDSQDKGTGNYSTLINKPQINGIELLSNKSLAELNIQPAGNYAEKRDIEELESKKVDKENGKGLSENDFTAVEKEKLVKAIIGAKVGKKIADIENDILILPNSGVNFASFSIDNQTGCLMINTPDESTDLTFSIDNKGYLQVEIGG